MPRQCTLWIRLTHMAFWWSWITLQSKLRPINSYRSDICPTLILPQVSFKPSYLTGWFEDVTPCQCCDIGNMVFTVNNKGERRGGNAKVGILKKNTAVLHKPWLLIFHGLIDAMLAGLCVWNWSSWHRSSEASRLGIQHTSSYLFVSAGKQECFSEKSSQLWA